MHFDAAEANKRIREQGVKLAKESAKLAHQQWVDDRNKYKDGYVPDVTFKRPSQELMDKIQKRNEEKNRHDKEERDKAFARSVERLKGVKGGRRTKRHKRSGKRSSKSRRR
jgi:hypothetical protein